MTNEYQRPFREDIVDTGLQIARHICFLTLSEANNVDVEICSGPRNMLFETSHLGTKLVQFSPVGFNLLCPPGSGRGLTDILPLLVGPGQIRLGQDQQKSIRQFFAGERLIQHVLYVCGEPLCALSRSLLLLLRSAVIVSSCALKCKGPVDGTVELSSS